MVDIRRCHEVRFTANAMRAMSSSSDRDQIGDLMRRFEVFKQKFDRGVSVQSAANLEAVLNAIGEQSLLAAIYG